MPRRAFQGEIPAIAGDPERRAEVRLALERASRLLVIRLRSLGDAILALPLIEALHAWRPELELDLLVESPYVAVFASHPAVHETLSVRPRSGPSAAGWARARACLEIRRRRYPAVLNLHGGSTSAFFALASGARMRIGQEKYRQSWIYHARIPAPARVWNRTDLHTAEDQLTLLRWLDVPLTPSPAGRLYLNPEAGERVRARLQSEGISPGAAAVIHPTSTLRTKQWPEENFAALADRIQELFGLAAIFTSAGHEARVLHDIGRHAARKHRYWSDLGLEELVALIAQCRLFVGNDSGPTHAAAALRTPLVVIWGSSDFRVWHPWEAPFEAVRLDLPCMPCPGYWCAAFDRPHCIENITVDMVVSACGRALGAGP